LSTVEKGTDDRVQPFRAARERGVVCPWQHAKLGISERVKYLQSVLERDRIAVS